jgi:hypothetical protein
MVNDAGALQELYNFSPYGVTPRRGERIDGRRWEHASPAPASRGTADGRLQ